MKSRIYFLASVSFALVLATHANAQTQTGPAPASGSQSSAAAGRSARTKAGDEKAMTAPANSLKQRSSLSAKTSKIPPPPAPSRRYRRTKTIHAPHATELDPYGRTDTAGHKVPFYGETRGCRLTESAEALTEPANEWAPRGRQKQRRSGADCFFSLLLAGLNTKSVA